MSNRGGRPARGQKKSGHDHGGREGRSRGQSRGRGGRRHSLQNGQFSDESKNEQSQNREGGRRGGGGEGKWRGGEGRGGGRGRGRSGRWDDTAEYDLMQSSDAVREFFRLRLFRKNAPILSPLEFLELTVHATEVETSNKSLRHQFLIKLTQSPYLEMDGPVLRTLMTYTSNAAHSSHTRQDISDLLKGMTKLTDLIEEITVRIPHCRNAQPYVLATIAIMDMVPFVTKEIKSRTVSIKETFANPTFLASFDDPSQNWSPDASFILEPILPDLDQLLNDKPDDCFINPVRGGFKSAAHYLETWYRLMREDFIATVRGAIIDFRNTFKATDKLRKRIRVDGGYHYNLEAILTTEKIDGDYYCLVKYSTEELKHVNWEHTDRLRFDSIMVMSNDHYKSARFAIITRHDTKTAKVGQVWLKMIGGPMADARNFHGIEPMAFYEPYRCVLERLKVLASRVDRDQVLPMGRYLVEVNKTVNAPSYIAGRYLTLPGKKVTSAGNPDLSGTGLDFSQMNALILALTKEFALIQGPPGTGKSHVGAMFVNIMMLNKEHWQTHDQGCMLLLAYKNHAIDQFIGECERMGMDMGGTVRVGSRSDVSMEKYQLANKRKELQNLHEFAHLSYEIRELKQKISEVDDTIHTCESTRKTENSRMRYDKYQQYLLGHFHYQFGSAYKIYLEKAKLENVDQLGLLSHIVINWATGGVSSYPLDTVEPLQYDDADTICEIYENIYQIPVETRAQLYAFWCETTRNDAERCLIQCREWHENLQQQLEEKRRYQDIAVLRRSDIVAMTTTGASKHGHLLDAVKPSIILVEEAAEVLESHIVAPLTQGCKHIVLIGDHQQLRPQVSTFMMEKKNLNISLFERLISNDIPSRRLEIQHRMHPEIASILVPHIYSSLQNHDSVHRYPPVRGLKKRMHFFNHDKPEEKVGEKSSCRNPFEADYIVSLCHYLLLQDYSPTDITILTTYMGQMRLIKEKRNHYCQKHPEPQYSDIEKQQLLKEEFKDYLDMNAKVNIHGIKMDKKTTAWYTRREKEYRMKQEQFEKPRSKMQDVRITTVDNYQGEECTIILLSFVRSNPQCNIGFLKWANRICVALSRAKHGFYTVGNFKLFAKNTKSPLWKNLCTQMLYETPPQSDSDPVPRQDPNLSSKLELVCKNHKVERAVDNPDMFLKLAPEGGCLEPCNYRLTCGHTCTRTCHIIDPKHKFFICRKNCQGSLECGHNCLRRCDIDGDDKTFHGRSRTPVEYRKCSTCSKNINCKEVEHITPDCGHEGLVLCSDKINYLCKTKVRFDLDCGHYADLACSTDKNSILCKVTVEEVLKCGHEMKRKCYDKGRKCLEMVPKLMNCYLHHKNVVCSEYDLSYICEENVEIRYSTCGHKQTVQCHEKEMETLKGCRKLVKKELSCGKHTKQLECRTIDFEIQLMKCHEYVEFEMPCQHIKKMKCCVSRDPTADGIKARMYCSEKVKKKLICGHEVTKICSDPNPTCTKVLVETRKCGHHVSEQCTIMNERKREGCKENVSLPKTCGHKMSIQCGNKIENVAYSPCHEKCLLKCQHTSCTRPCNSPCKPCIEPCMNRCPHSACSKACGEECDRTPCNEPCAKNLPCGHVCTGWCGELCPTGCREKKCKAIARKGRRIRILPCHHDFTPLQLDKHMKVTENSSIQEVVTKYCPMKQCGVVISECPRYVNQIKRYLQVTKLKEYDRNQSWWYCIRGSHFINRAKGTKISSVTEHKCNAFRHLNVLYQFTDRARYNDDRIEDRNDERKNDAKPAGLDDNPFFNNLKKGADRLAGSGFGRGGRRARNEVKKPGQNRRVPRVPAPAPVMYHPYGKPEPLPRPGRRVPGFDQTPVREGEYPVGNVRRAQSQIDLRELGELLDDEQDGPVQDEDGSNASDYAENSSTDNDDDDDFVFDFERDRMRAELY